MWKLTFTTVALSACLMIPDSVMAQRGGGRGNSRGAENSDRQSDRGGSDRSRSQRGNSGNNSQQNFLGGRGIGIQPSARIDDPRNSGRNINPGQILENRIRGEVNNALGLPYGLGQSRNDGRGRDWNDGDGRRGQYNFDGRSSFNNRSNFDGRSSFDGRSNFDGRSGGWGNPYQNNLGFQSGFNRGGFGSGSFGRYANNPLAALILQQFPSASQLLLPRGRGNNGAFYRSRDQYYYYPNVYNNYPVMPQTSTVYVQPTPQLQSEPIPVEFGGYAYVAELSPVFPLVINDLCLDMHYNYQGNGNHAVAYRNAYEMLTVSKTLQQSYEAGDRDGVKQHLLHIDRLLHVVEQQTQGWQRNHQQQIGEMGLITKLEIVSDMTHHLMYDVGILTAEHDAATARDTSPPGFEYAPPSETGPTGIGP